MSLNLGRQMILFSGLFLLLLICENQAKEATDDNDKQNDNSDEDDSSSEETIEADSKEESTRRRRRRRRFADISSNNDESKNIAPRIGIPGLPDPAAILKIAEILQTVGEKVVPILIEGIPKADVVSERISKDLQFLKNFKQEIELFSGEFKMK